MSDTKTTVYQGKFVTRGSFDVLLYNDKENWKEALDFVGGKDSLVYRLDKPELDNYFTFLIYSNAERTTTLTVSPNKYIVKSESGIFSVYNKDSFESLFKKA